MNNFNRLLAASFLCMSSVISIAPVCAATADDMADPPRWTREDTTPRQRYESARKEAAAAQKNSLEECATMPQAERKDCIKEVRAIYLQEMSDAKKLLSE